MKILRNLTVVAAILLGACSGRANNFGGDDDAGRPDAMFDDATLEPDADIGPRAVGEPCNGPTSCIEGALCIGAIDGEFRCMKRCTTPYDLCLDGSVCLPVTAQDASICYMGGIVPHEEACTNNLDCAPGLLCFGSGDQFYCRDACDDRVGSCDDGQYCLRLASGAGLCREDVGAPCPGAACASGLSCSVDDPELAGTFPGGYCTKYCEASEDCTAGSVCRGFPGATRSVCLGTCDHDSDCRFNAGYRCLDASSCSTSSDPQACQSFFGDASFCLAEAP